MTKICKDCVTEWEAFPEPKGPVTYRPRPLVERSGGRCATHWRTEKARRKKAAHENRVQKVYGLGPGIYDLLYQHQGGRCALCQRATGATRRLSVDHDHVTGLVRMLACRPCNDMLGHGRDDPGFFRRVAALLENPPAKQLGIVAVYRDNREGSDGDMA